MTSRSERRLACPVAARTQRTTTETARDDTTSILCPGALDAPQEIFVATVWFAASNGTGDGGLGSVFRTMRPLGPLLCEPDRGSLACRFLCTGVDPVGAAWRTIDRIRELTDRPLLRVEIGPADAPEPAVVFTSEMRRFA